MFKSIWCHRGVGRARATLASAGVRPTSRPKTRRSSFFISCQNRFRGDLPGKGARPMMRQIDYIARNGANLPARQFIVERGDESLQRHRGRISHRAGGGRSGHRFRGHEFAQRGRGAVSRPLGEYDPGFPGPPAQYLPTQQPASCGLRSIWPIITWLSRRANAEVNDFPAIQFEQSITIIDDKGGGLRYQPRPTPCASCPCQSVRAGLGLN